MQYKYDEEGGQFLTFVLTFLLLLLLPLTYSLLAGVTSGGKRRAKGTQGWFDAKGQKVAAIAQLKRRSITNPQLSKTAIFVVVGWSVVFFLARRIANAASNSSHAVYDPFQILGITSAATQKEIKKHYKKLSIKFHPDKLRLAVNQTKEEAEGHYIELTKAYKSLTDDTIRKNFELYGHPDGRQEMSMGIALPTWVVEGQNNIWVLGVYGLVFGIGLPYLVARWWYGSRAQTKDGIINASAQTFFQHLREDTPPARIVALVAISEEFADPALERAKNEPHKAELDELEKQVREKLAILGPRWDIGGDFRTRSIRKALVLLYAYLFRLETPSATLTKQRYEASVKAEKLLNGMLSIALAHNWSDLTLTLMDMIQAFVQAVPPSSDIRAASELLQLPHVTLQQALTISKKSKLGDLGLQGFCRMEDAQRRKLLEVGKESGMTEQQYDEAVKVAREWPRMELTDSYFKVNGERLVTTGAIVQFVVKAKTLPFRLDSVTLNEGVRQATAKARMEQESSVRPSTEDDDEVKLDHLIGRTDAVKGKEGRTPVLAARAPHFLEERKPHWWVMIGDLKQSRIIVQPTKMTDVGSEQERTFSVQFQAPPQAGVYTFSAIVKSDAFLGSDAVMPITLKVEDAAALDDDLQEDDISDPDEDTLAGQMAVMRGEKVKSSRMQDADEDDSSATEEEAAKDDEEDSESDWD